MHLPVLFRIFCICWFGQLHRRLYTAIKWACCCSKLETVPVSRASKPKTERDVHSAQTPEHEPTCRSVRLQRSFPFTHPAYIFLLKALASAYSIYSGRTSRVFSIERSLETDFAIDCFATAMRSVVPKQGASNSSIRKLFQKQQVEHTV